MKISISECDKAAASGKVEAREKILPKNMPRKSAGASPRANLTPLEQGIMVAQSALMDIPDTRDEIVDDLKKRIEKGEYNVSGEDIADMMMRRRNADRIR